MVSSKFSRGVGKRIKSLREKANLTQAEVAKKANININYFAVIERGEVSTAASKLQRISKALGVDVSDILSSK